MTSAVYRGSVYLFCLIYVPLVGWPTYYHGKQLRSSLDYNTRCIARKTCFRGFRPGLWYTPTHTGLCSHNRCPNKGLTWKTMCGAQQFQCMSESVPQMIGAHQPQQACNEYTHVHCCESTVTTGWKRGHISWDS